MLSQGLDNLAANLRRLNQDGVTPSPLSIEAIADQVRGFAEQARGLERHTVPFPARLDAFNSDRPGMAPVRSIGASS